MSSSRGEMEPEGFARHRSVPVQHWLFRAVPIEGESLQGYCLRCAIANGVTLRHLAQRSAGRYLPASCDLDVLDRTDVAVMAATFRVQTEELTALTFSCFIWDWILPDSIHSNWVAQNKRQLSGEGFQPVCLSCLQSDVVPHLRLEWRLCFASHCLTHDCALLEICGGCLRNFLSGKLRALCGSCDRKNRPEVSGSRPLPFKQLTWVEVQRQILDKHASPVILDHLDIALPIQLLTGVRTLLAILRMPKAGCRLRKILADKLDLAQDDLSDEFPNQHRFEGYGLMRRSRALQAIALLLEDWPYQFEALANDAGILAHHFASVERYMPHWLEKVVTSVLTRKAYRPSDEEVAAALQAATVGGVEPTKIAIGALIGSRDLYALDRAVGRRRRRMSKSEAAAFFKSAYSNLEAIPASRTQRLCAVRTLAMLAVSASTGQTLEEVCGLAPARAKSALSRLPVSLQRLVIASYPIADDGEGLAFKSRFDGVITGASARLTARKLIHAFAPGEIVRSSDALKGIWHPNRMS